MLQNLEFKVYKEPTIFWWTAIILGVVEGLTEFLPVSSTGHLIVVGHFLGFSGPVAVTFEIVIQLGAILGVLFYLWQKILAVLRGALQGGPSRLFVLGIGVAFLPAALVGLLTHEYIETHLFNPTTVAFALILGGVVILLVERYHPIFKLSELNQVRPLTALWVGMAQVLALFPGVSRSGATIMGGLLAGMRRDVATEFSFFLSIPTMLMATSYDFYKSRHLFVADDLWILGLGLGMAFLTALVVVATFLRFIKTHTFKPFAYYRIVFGLMVLMLLG
jgi:undecaprenyl-diphosphatase